MTAAVGILQVPLDPTLSDAEWGFVLSTDFWSMGVVFRRGQRARGVRVHDHDVQRLKARIAPRNRRAHAAVSNRRAVE